MYFCKVTIFKQFQEFFQPHDGVKCLKALEMLEMHFKREISNLSYFQADALFPDDHNRLGSVWTGHCIKDYTDFILYCDIL
jgi:hypothetical protein